MAKYAGPKGNLKFPFDQPLPLALIARIVRHKVKQDIAKARCSQEEITGRKANVLHVVAVLLTVALFAGMLVVPGDRPAHRRRAARADPDGLTKGASAAEGAVFALLGLLLAFTFSGAASRFEDRRWFINSEANAIGTAYLRLDLLPAEAQPPLRDLFRRYADNFAPPSTRAHKARTT